MSLLQTIAIWLSSTLVLIGLASLIATWLMPSVLERSLLRWLITGRRMAPSRYNRTLISVWAIAIGCYILLSVLGYRMASFIAFVICCVFFTDLIRLRKSCALLIRYAPSLIKVCVAPKASTHSVIAFFNVSSVAGSNFLDVAISVKIVG